MATVMQILRTKQDNNVYSVPPNTSAFDAAQLMKEKHIGGLLVMEKGRIVGIVTERDLMQTCSECTSTCEKVMSLPVSEIMSRNLIIGLPDDTIDHAMGVMSQNSIRHLPIMSDRKIEGMISLRDLVDARLEETTYEVRYLKDYISGSLT